MKVWRETDAKLSRETKARKFADAWSMLLAMLKHSLEYASSSAQAVLKQCSSMQKGDPMRVVRATYGEHEQIMCKSWNLILQFALRRGGCPTKSCVRRYAAGSNFSLAMGSASRKVCIGVLP